jgi:NADH-quinone oxidoreductase subunit N
MPLIGAFYYLRVIRLMYFDEADDKSPLQAGFDVRLLVSVNGLAVLLLGLFANPLLAICAAAIG